MKYAPVLLFCKSVQQPHPISSNSSSLSASSCLFTTSLYTKIVLRYWPLSRGDTTHVFYAALAPRASLAEEEQVNLEMLRNLLVGLRAASALLQRVALYQGAKVNERL